MGILTTTVSSSDLLWVNLILISTVSCFIINSIQRHYLLRKNILVSKDGVYMNIKEYREYIQHHKLESSLGFFSRKIMRTALALGAAFAGSFPIIFVETPGVGSYILQFIFAILMPYFFTKSYYAEVADSTTVSNLLFYTPDEFSEKGKYIVEPLKFQDYFYELEMKKAKIQEKNCLIEKKEQKLEKATVEGNEKKMKKHTSSLKKLGKELKQMENELNSILDKIESCISDRPTQAMYKILKRNATLGKDLAPTLTSLETDQAVDFLNVFKVSEDEVPKQRYHIEVLENIKQNENLPGEIRKEAEEILELHRLQEDVEKKEETFKDVELDLKVARNIVENNGDMRRSISENII